MNCLEEQPKYFSLVKTLDTPDLRTAVWDRSFLQSLNKKEILQSIPTNTVQSNITKSIKEKVKIKEKSLEVYRILPFRQQSQNGHQGVQVLDITRESSLEKEEYEDPLMSQLMPMVRDYLHLSNQNTTSLQNINKKEALNEDYVYDIYYRNDELSTLESIKLGQLIWEEQSDFLHEASSSEHGDDDYDSNAESNERNDYPEEENGSEFEKNSLFEHDIWSQSSEEEEDDDAFW
jgi:hypothetical protein